MTINLDFERIEKALSQIDKDARATANEQRPVDDSDPIGLRLALKFHADPAYQAALGKFAMGMMILPQECCAALIAVGYMMGQEDAKSSGEIAELNRLFAVGEKK